ncbi:IclR family transcriptional regulator [Alloalcanivorax sp. C16-2]|uniref:IclR family transcriptional regulator n=1 Tax=Alloalcanivorax TaxID=3020832 RepID=UPI001931B18F|nr:IclR family transcriptional regulator [Alloalcanivorax marinus]MBL7249210.1 IclR family transcriptional regulator [Alloalcanivorax marinus]
MTDRQSRTNKESRIEPVDITPAKTEIVLDERAALPRHGETSEEGKESVKPAVTIQSVERALDILEYVADAKEPRKLHDIARAVGLKSPTCHHLLNSLVRRGYVRRNARPRSYYLGPKVIELGHRQGASTDMREAAAARLAELARDSGASAVMSVLNGTTLTLLLEQPAAGGIVLDGYREGVAMAAHATALGKAILAWLPESQVARVVADHGLTPFTGRTIDTLAELVEALRQIRRHGFAVEDGEYRGEVSGLAVALRDRSGSVVGSIGCLIPRDSDEMVRMRELQSKVRSVAKAISRLS